MRLIKTEDAVGHVLCHDMTQIIKDQYKDARFRKGHVVTEEDIPVLLSMGKEHLYVWEMTSGMVHENDAAERLLALCGQENMIRSGVKEGKIELKAACDGVFLVDSARLVAVNSQDEVMIATRKGGMAVREGDKLAGMRVIPLIIEEEKLRKAEQAAGDKPLLSLKPYVRKTACIVATGGEVKKGLIKDTFTPVLPGAMFLLGYFDDGMPVMGLPGCVMYAGATVFDLVLPKIAADVPVTRADLAALGEGGLCLGCKPCHYPICPFGS